MLNNRGELISSIKKDCKDYNPDKTKPTEVRCDKLGMLYECKNHKGTMKGCLFCERYIPLSQRPIR